MKRYYLMLCFLIACNTAFADVGPLTRAMQEEFAKTGQCYFKYYDYSHSRMANSFTNKDKPLKPSSVIEYSKSTGYEAHRLTMLLHRTGSWYLWHDGKAVNFVDRKAVDQYAGGVKNPVFRYDGKGIRVFNDTICIPYELREELGWKFIKKGEFRFKWNDQAQWFGIEDVVY
ncbi:MAG: hypothetical protein IKZ43_01920 [Acidaminococcaceae bacterium]|nr:hypothetical protein [Acidaminococcaceae bacterium]